MGKATLKLKLQCVVVRISFVSYQKCIVNGLIDVGIKFTLQESPPDRTEIGRTYGLGSSQRLLYSNVPLHRVRELQFRVKSC